MATAVELMTVDIPRADTRQKVGDILAALRRQTWDEVGMCISSMSTLAQEALIGTSIGAIVAVVAAGGPWLWNGHPAMAMVVGASLGVTAVVATVMASVLPLGLARLGADPAVASGPVATVVQDILSGGDLSDDCDRSASGVTHHDRIHDSTSRRWRL